MSDETTTLSSYAGPEPAFAASVKLPELPARIRDAVPLLALRSGFDERWWLEAMKSIVLHDCIANVDGGCPMDEGSLRGLDGGTLAHVMVAQIGTAPPPALEREFALRVETVREVRHPRDEKWIGSDAAALQCWRAWRAIQQVVAAAAPDRGEHD